MRVKVLPQALAGIAFGKKFVGKTKNVTRRSRGVVQLESLSLAIRIARVLDSPAVKLILKPPDCGILGTSSFQF